VTERSALHDTFRIDRHFDAAPARVFRAFADPAAKAKWFGGPVEMKRESFDFREGGREATAATFDNGTTFTYTATYTDIVPDERIVYTYEMSMNGQRISVSVATIELRATATGTDFAITEQGVYLDGLDNSAQRKQGTEELMDALAKTL
jgi:uncharacterized protein YndB with AHSA1/START domain